MHKRGIRTKILSVLAAGALLFPAATSCSQRGGESLVLDSEDDLSGLTVSCSAGSYHERKLTSRGDVNVFACNSEADALQAMRQGLADVFVSDEVMLTEEMMERLGVRLALRGSESFPVAFALRKGNDKFKDELNRFLAEAPIDEIFSSWLHGTEAPPFEGKEIDDDAEPLRCITAVNMEPICYLGEDGKWMGADADILQRFAAWSGRPFEMSFQSMGSAVIALQTGQADIVSACLFVTEERKKSVDFSNNYFHCRPGYFVSDKHKGSGVSLADRLKMNLVTENRWKLITGGLWETLKITLLAILLGTILGVGVCAAKRSRKKWVREAASLYGSFIAGIPTLVLLLIMFYVVLAETPLSATAVAVVTFSLCFASSAGNIFDTAISSVPKGQTEAGLSLGFTPLKTFNGIVFPQALRKGLPLFAGECVSLLKNTSIVGYIAIQDLTRASDLIRSRTFDAVIPLLIVTILYFILAWIIRKLLNLCLPKK